MFQVEILLTLTLESGADYLNVTVGICRPNNFQQMSKQLPQTNF